MKECPSCKAQVSEDCKFCTNCGTPISDVKKVEEKKEEVKVEETKVEQPKVETTAAAAPAKKSGEGLGVASLVLGIIALLLSLISGLIIPIILQAILVIIGIILGIINLAKGGKKFAGLIINGVSIVTGVIFFFIFWGLITVLGISFLDSYSKYVWNEDKSLTGYYKCASSLTAAENGQYTSTIDLYSNKKFTWRYTGSTDAVITGTYTSETIEKDNSMANTKYYSITMTADKVTKDGEEIKSSAGKVNKYEVGVSSSGGKKELAMINAGSYSIYYCVEG